MRAPAVTTATLTLAELKQIIVETLRLDAVAPESIADHEILFGGRLGLDSIDALEIVVALEQRLGVRIRLHDMEAESFKTVATMHGAIQSYLASQPAGPE